MSIYKVMQHCVRCKFPILLTSRSKKLTDEYRDTCWKSQWTRCSNESTVWQACSDQIEVVISGSNVLLHRHSLYSSRTIRWDSNL